MYDFISLNELDCIKISDSAWFSLNTSFHFYAVTWVKFIWDFSFCEFSVFLVCQLKVHGEQRKSFYDTECIRDLDSALVPYFCDIFELINIFFGVQKGHWQKNVLDLMQDQCAKLILSNSAIYTV